MPSLGVLIVGAGPTGLTLACELRRHGLSPRIVDKAPRATTLSKAIGVHARTLTVVAPSDPRAHAADWLDDFRGSATIVGDITCPSRELASWDALDGRRRALAAG